MAKGFLGSAKSYTKNLGKLFWRVATREEAASDVLDHLKRDTQKLKHSMERRDSSKGNHKAASRLVDDGRLAYNGGHYGQAEDYFRRALIEDHTYTWAYTYLGHSLYKQGRRDEAVVEWERAIKCDPDSDAANKARRKIQHVEKSKYRTAQELEERTREF